MKISPVPKETDLNSQPWQKWFSSLFEFGKKPETVGDVIIDNSEKGLVLQDTSGNYWRVSVSTDGTLTTTSIGSNLP